MRCSRGPGTGTATGGVARSYQGTDDCGVTSWYHDCQGMGRRGREAKVKGRRYGAGFGLAVTSSNPGEI